MSLLMIFVLFIYFFVCVLLMGIILIQAGKGGGLSSLGSSSTPISDTLGTTSAERTLMYATWGIAFGFLFLALILSIWGSRAGGSQSFRDAPAPAPLTGAPTIPGAIDPLAPPTLPVATPAIPDPSTLLPDPINPIPTLPGPVLPGATPPTIPPPPR